ncbi:thyrostimulin alpha-2 subunit-like [Centruroides vittatus]|uniref:thyrostimulin alpha-2 subunit-like n=1 Tax=Centruroides vittatus TaxID=120091 RepID=UPI00350EF61B
MRFILLTCCIALFGHVIGGNVWDKPGCYRVGHTRNISIPDCVEFQVTTNACRGYCDSYSVPSPEGTIKVNPNQRLTSYAKCCNIMETEDVNVQVLCLDGLRDLVFKSAIKCSCFQCLKY